MKSIKIPIKVGSHLTIVYPNNDQMNCETFIRICLLQCGVVKNINMINSFKKYSLFEQLNGVEVIIDYHENICNLWAIRWSANDKIQLVIKKFQKSKHLTRMIENNQKKRRQESELREERLTRIQLLFFTNPSNMKLKRRIRNTHKSEDTNNADYEDPNHHYEEIRVKYRNEVFFKNLRRIFKK